MAAFPICRQSRLVVWDQAYHPGAASTIVAAISRIVALRHIGRVYCNLFTCRSLWKRLNLHINFIKFINGYLIATHF
jgi:hypothetical protein